MAGRQDRAGEILALQPAPRHATARAGLPGQAALAHRTGLPRTQRHARPGSLRRALLARLASPRHARLGRARLLDDRTAPPPANAGGRLISLNEVVRELQALLACWQGTCPTCSTR